MGPGMNMYHVYLLQGGSGRHYIGMTLNLERRLAQHRQGHTYTTRRLGGDLQLLASKEYDTHREAAAVERQLKAWKNPAKVLTFLSVRRSG
jgi:putative endonuclease